MPKVKNVEKKIWDVEGFDVRVTDRDGKDLRGDMKGLPQYNFDRMAKNSLTVETWKTNRFRPSYPGFDVEVINGDGEGVPGNTLLSNVRDTYADDG